MGAAFPSDRSDLDKFWSETDVRNCEVLNASGVLKETIRIAISALNDDVPGCVRVAAWLDGDVLREQTTDIGAAAAAASAAATAARIAAASTPPLSPPPPPPP